MHLFTPVYCLVFAQSHLEHYDDWWLM